MGAGPEQAPGSGQGMPRAGGALHLDEASGLRVFRSGAWVARGDLERAVPRVGSWNPTCAPHGQPLPALTLRA